MLLIILITLLLLQSEVQGGISNFTLRGGSARCICHYFQDNRIPIIDCSSRNIYHLPSFETIVMENTAAILLQNNNIRDLTINPTVWKSLETECNPIECNLIEKLNKQNISVKSTNCTEEDTSKNTSLPNEWKKSHSKIAHV